MALAVATADAVRRISHELHLQYSQCGAPQHTVADGSVVAAVADAAIGAAPLTRCAVKPNEVHAHTVWSGESKGVRSVQGNY